MIPMQSVCSPVSQFSRVRGLVASSVTAGALALALSGTASAAIVTVQLDFDGPNDCSGDLGSSPECEFNDSPQILKQNLADDGAPGGLEKNPIFTSIDGTEFAFSNDTLTDISLSALASEDGDNWKSGSWTYTRDDTEDPLIRYVSLKYATNYSILFDVDDADASFPGVNACSGWGGFPDAPPMACQDLLDLALPITSGAWSNLSNGLSHIMFLDTDGGDIPVVPAPGTLALLGFGLAGGALIRRRRRGTN